MFDSQTEIEMNLFDKRDDFSRKQTRLALSVVSHHNSMDIPNSTTAPSDFEPKLVASSGPMQRPRTPKKTIYKHIPHSEKPAHLVAKRNERERRRVQAVNSAFLRLRKHVPHEPRHKRLSKFKTLKVAIQYIRQMQDLIRAHDKQHTAKHRNTSRYYDDNTRNTRHCRVGSKMSSSPHTPGVPKPLNVDHTKDIDVNNYYSCSKRENGVGDSKEEKVRIPFQHPVCFPAHSYSPRDRKSTREDGLHNKKQYQINETEQLHCANHYSPPAISDSFVNMSDMTLPHKQSQTQCPVLSRQDFGLHGNQWISPLRDNHLQQSLNSVLEPRTHSATPDSISSLDSWNSGVPCTLVYSTFHENTIGLPASTSDSLSSCSSNSTGFFSNY